MTAPNGKPVPPPPPPPPKATASPPVTVALPEVGELFGPEEGAPGYWINLAGPPKLGGKTTFAVGSPRPIFVLTDRGGLKGFPRTIQRRAPMDWPEVLRALHVLRDKVHDYQTVVLDTVFAAETLAIKHLCKNGMTTLKALGGGYGAGYEMLVSEINKVIDIFFTLNAQGIHTIAIHQTEDKTIHSADMNDYEKTAFALQKKTALLWAAAGDVNAFAQPQMEKISEEEGRIKVRFTGRVACHVRPTTGIDAGNRLFLDSPMPYSWAALEIGAAEGAKLKEELYAYRETLSPEARAWADVELNNAGWSKEAARRVMSMGNK